MIENGKIKNKVKKPLENIIHSNLIQNIYDRFACTNFPSVDIIDQKDSFIFIFEMSGINKNNFTLEFKSDRLIIKGTKMPPAFEDSQILSSEICYGEFNRIFKLPDDIEPDKITAKQIEGILTVIIPKKEKSIPRKIQIDITQNI